MSYVRGSANRVEGMIFEVGHIGMERTREMQADGLGNRIEMGLWFDCRLDGENFGGFGGAGGAGGDFLHCDDEADRPAFQMLVFDG